MVEECAHLVHDEHPAPVDLADVGQHAGDDPFENGRELACVMAGRQTYSLDSVPAQLTRRRASRMRLQPPGKPRRFWHKYDVLPAHECGNAIADNLRAESMLEYVPPKRIDPHEPAPF